MIVYDVETKVLDTESFPQRNIAGLYIWQYIHCSVQSGEAFTVDGNTHTHTHIHTHTHTCWQKNLRSTLWIDLLTMIIIRLYFWLYYAYLLIDLLIDWYFIRGCDFITPIRAFWLTIFFFIMMLLKDRLNQIYGEII